MPNQLSLMKEIPEDVLLAIAQCVQEPHSLFRLVTASRYTNRLFKPIVQESLIFDAVFMGNEDIAAKIIKDNPAIMFTRRTYQVPLLNPDGTKSNLSEQIYHNVTPLELLLYTGDFKMWQLLFPLMPVDMFSKVLVLMNKVKRGGPDLVKVNFDIREETGWKNLKGSFNGLGLNILSNPDGIIFYTNAHETLCFYVHYESRTIELLNTSSFSTEEDKEKFRLFQNSLDDKLDTDVGFCRSSDEEHALIKHLFGKNLERNGIHYELNGVHFHDTHDGCYRLINAYIKYINTHVTFFNNEEHGWHRLDQLMISLIGGAQRIAMTNIMQRFMEPDNHFHPLPEMQNLKTRPLERSINKFDTTFVPESGGCFYPSKLGAGCGFEWAIHRGMSQMAMSVGKNWINGRLRAVENDLAAVLQIVHVTNQQFDELEQNLAQQLHPSPSL